PVCYLLPLTCCDTFVNSSINSGVFSNTNTAKPRYLREGFTSTIRYPFFANSFATLILNTSLCVLSTIARSLRLLPTTFRHELGYDTLYTPPASCRSLIVSPIVLTLP